MVGVNKCIKYSMFIFNVLFWMCGSIILGVAVWLRVSKEVKKMVDMEEFYPAINLLITVGSIIMVLGFLGCCGAIKESKCMLILFFIGLLLILTFQITAGILGVVYKSKIASILNETYSELIPLNKQEEKFRKEVEDFQEEKQCCGLLHGYQDWTEAFIPPSCNCKDKQACVITENGKSVWAQPCISAINDILKANLILIIGIAFGLAVIEIFGLAFSMILYCQIKNK
ncbi:tetraspanin-8-like isoform X1 [Chiloscyllium plagiosum]|uniref:tetraspanin-8-like isoform X1 n=2 Tax=Chiloscyllium plagiosum TaxID=36176 RepID=UPI001CB7CACC|nr:tetraspanin-8-like isoform X1 [Chiloscyllium plagiosum]